MQVSSVSLRAGTAALLSAATLGFVVFVSGGVHAQTPSPAPLVFVADHAYAPVSFLQDGVATGLDVDLVHELERVLGRPIHLQLLDFTEARRRVQAGEADAVTDLGISPERRVDYDFSDATVTHEFGLYVRRNDTSVRGLADLSGKRVGVTTSPFAGQFLERQSGAEVIQVKSIDDGFVQLLAGSIDVVALDTWVAAARARDLEKDITLVGTPFATSATAIAVKKGRVDLLNEINRGLRQLRAEGTLSRIEEKWRPREMLFLPELRVEQVAVWAIGALLVALIAAMAAWVYALKRGIRDRRAIESALAASEAKFSKAFRASPDSMSIFDGETRRLVEVNDHFVEASGFSREELIGHTSAELGMVIDLDYSDKVAADILRTGSARDIEYQVRRKKGNISTVVGSAETIDLAGRRSILWVHRDVTRARELEVQLRHAQKMDAVGRLAAGVAHDFNNLLTVILGNCEVGAPLLGPDDPLRGTLRDISFAAERAAALTHQLLAFSRRQIVQPRRLLLNDVVKEIEPMVARLIGEDIEVRLTLDPFAGCIQADPGEVHQVLLNLAVNARDAMPSGGRLTIETRYVPAGQLAVLAVTDTGTGMDEATRQRIFEPFFTTKDQGQGTGIGLATVHSVVLGCGGTIEVDSQPGQGSTFRVFWPRVGEALAESASVPLATNAAPGHEYVLLVEDDADVRDLLSDYLGRLGYEVMAARSGEDALAMTHGQRAPDILITDIVMPGISGRMLADQLTKRFPALRVLYLSGYTDDAIVRRGVLASDVHFLQKPLSLATLAHKVREILDVAAAER